MLLRAALWPMPRNGRGTILLLQGRAEFIEKYFETAGELLARGFGVATFDWRGQGGSDRALPDGRKGHVGDFEEFRRDIEAVATGLLADMPGPVHGLAHSMGGCVALAGAAEGWLPVSRLVAIAPMLGLTIIRHPGAARVAARLLRRAGLGSAFVPGGSPRSISLMPFEGNRLSSDPGRYARNADLAERLGAAAVGAPTVAWLDSAYAAMRRLAEPGTFGRIAIPILLVGAGRDPVCSTAAIEALGRGLPIPAVVIPESRHEILMETDAIRARFWAAFDAFVPGSDREAAARASGVEKVEHGPVEVGIAAGDDAPPAGG